MNEHCVAHLSASPGIHTAQRADRGRHNSTGPLIDPEGESVINIGSLSGQMATPGLSIYSATKGALNSITVSLSKELGPRKIRINALNPGMVATEGLRSSGVMGNEFEVEVLKVTPLGRLVGQRTSAKSQCSWLRMTHLGSSANC